jgi:hypothetical protein
LLLLLQGNEEKSMKKLSTYALLFAACLGTTVMLAASKGVAPAQVGSEERFAADGAFRDGLYLGKLAAEAGQPLRPTIGRWSTEQDRSMFTVGYARGYSDSLAGEPNTTDSE